MYFYLKYDKLCKQKGFAPSRVALDLGISKTAVSNWKKGGNPSPENLLKIAEFFDVPPSYFDDDVPDTPQPIDPILYETAQVRVLIDTFMQLDEIKKAKLLVYASELAQQ